MLGATSRTPLVVASGGAVVPVAASGAGAGAWDSVVSGLTGFELASSVFDPHPMAAIVSMARSDKRARFFMDLVVELVIGGEGSGIEVGSGIDIRSPNTAHRAWLTVFDSTATIQELDGNKRVG